MAAPLLRQIKASAGSGKTYDLTRRFLELLARVRQEAYAPACALAGAASAPGWGDILAVTFTNGAADEMKERVVRRLKETALGLALDAPIEAARAAAWVDVILRQYGALNIRTIDSLLHMVVRTAALDLNLPPDFQPAFTTGETLAPILDACLERAWRGEPHMLRLLEDVCRGLIHHGDAKGFTAGERIARHLRPLLDDAFTGAWPVFSSRREVEHRHADMARAVIVSARELLRRVDEEDLRMDKRARAAVEACAAPGGIGADSAYLRKDGLEGLLLTADRSKASDAARAAFMRLATAAAEWNGPGHILRQALRLLPLAELAKEAAAGLETFQREQGKVPGVLMPALAREVLELEHGVSAALCRLGSGLNHMLVDEFQDTSRPQWQALRPLVEEALARGGSFTWVGDVKQAIYGWREGDASLFDGILRDKGLLAIAPGPERQSLDTNWRSREVVVRCNNAVFSRLGHKATARTALEVLLPRDCPPDILDASAEAVAGTFADAAQRIRPQGAEGGHVTITPVRGENAEDLAQAVRRALRARILEDLAPRRSWGDMAVLVRGNDVAAQVAGWLMEWGVPVITENSLLLGEHPLIAETLAFLAFLDCPRDDAAFWAALTGSLMAPCLESPGAPDAATLRDWAVIRRNRSMGTAFREDFPDFWQRWFAPFHSRANLLSPYDAVQEWLRLLRVAERFPQAGTFVRRFLEVLHMAEEQGHATLGEFLEHWKREGGDEKVPMPVGADAVRVMTIHKSKGLQFPVVVIPGMSFPLNDKDPPAVPWEMSGLRVLAPRCRQMGHIYYAAQAEAAQEALNLWYVAWTRPEEELHVLHVSTPALARGRNLGRAINVLLPEAELEPPRVLGAPPPGGRKTDGSAPEAPPPAPASPHELRDRRPMHWLPRLKIYRNPLGELSFTPKQRGILAHRCLECLRLTGDTPQQRLEDARRAVAQALRAFSPPAPHAAGIEEELIRALAWFAALPDTARWLLHGLPEQNILDAQGRLHRVDLLIPPMEGHGWTAVEYKTGEENAEHEAQMRRYLSLLDALPERKKLPPPQGVLVYLDLRRRRVIAPTDAEEEA